MLRFQEQPDFAIVHSYFCLWLNAHLVFCLCFHCSPTQQTVPTHQLRWHHSQSIHFCGSFFLPDLSVHLDFALAIAFITGNMIKYMELYAFSWSFHGQFLFDKLAYKKAFKWFFL